VKRLILLVAVLTLIGCAANIVKFEQYSVSMNLKVAADSSVTIGSDEQFFGVLWLNSILKTENVPVEKIKLIQNYGRYFVCAENFKHVWLVEPEEDGLSGEYKAIDVTPKDKTDGYNEIGFSRYGSRENACVKFRFNKTEVFIDRKGNVHEKCGK
jgi:hypothetical protein